MIVRTAAAEPQMTYSMLTYATDEGPRAGLLIDGRVFDAARAAGNEDYKSVLGILADWSKADQAFAAIAAAPESGAGIALTEVTLLAPVLYPGEIWAAGANYADHIGEMGNTDYRAVNAKTVQGGRAWHFSKTSRSAIVGHGTINPLPAYSRKVDWEIELAVVIGKTARKVSAKDALDYVAGYTIANDLSARDFVTRDGIEPVSPFRFDWLSHKGFDGACPLGPWITPARYISDPQALGLKLWIDDELMQDSNTRFMIFSVAEQIEEISARATMHPGDIILTGTPSGVGMTRNRFLEAGQHLRLWIEGIGELHHGFT